MGKHRVFISYHHKNDQAYKEYLVKLSRAYDIFDDYSVNSGDIDDNGLNDEQIRVIVRDEYLRDSSVTIVLVGTETRSRKHVDWELFSSMRDSPINKKSGIILINLPSTGSSLYVAAHGDLEKKAIYPENSQWSNWTRSQYESNFAYMSPRMIDNLVEPSAKISVVPWSKIEGNAGNLAQLIEFAYLDRADCEYDLHTPMKRSNG